MLLTKYQNKTKDWTLDNERTGKVISPSLFTYFFGGGGGGDGLYVFLVILL